MKLTHNCPKCGRPAQIQSEFPIGNFMNYVYRCGHTELKIKIAEVKSNEEIPVKEVPSYTQHEMANIGHWVYDYGTKVLDCAAKPPKIHESFYSVDKSKCAYPFQIDGIKFAESTQLNCLIADAMGLGKTIQGLISLKRNYKVAFPAIAIVKGATIFQWQHEYSEWVSKEFTSCMPLVSRANMIKGFDFYIMSMDMLSRKDVIESLLKLDIKTVIIDEVQNFKDPSAKRTKALIRLIAEGNIKYKIALSGTPIKNRAVEYFTILNILAPSHFLSLDEFKRYWLVPNEKGIYTKINPYRLDKFKEVTSKFILRRERTDVLKNLPSLTRDYQIIEIDDPAIKNSYNHTLDLFANWMRNNGKTGVSSSELLGWLAQLRSITGQAKCKNAIEWVRDFLESTDESIAIGIQHHAVRDTLYYVLDQFKINPLKLSGEDNVYRKNDIVRRFTSGDNRVLIINSIAGGVGLNLQTCANALILERQWNSADEEQFEARFHRDGQKNAVTITYMIAKNTIDEFFHNMVCAKRKILVETGIGTQFDVNNDVDFLKDLSDYVVSHKI